MVAEPTTQTARAINQLQIPIGVATLSDARRLANEAEVIDNFLHQATIRQPGTALQLPKSSKLFDEIVAINQLNMLLESDRLLLGQFLQAVLTTAPVMHISFSADPSPIFLGRLITWMRQQMHPFVLLQIGLHPNIGAGCVVRTTNKYHDFSLRSRFSEQRMLLISKLRGSETVANPTTPAVAGDAKP